METNEATQPAYLAALNRIIDDIVAPNAVAIDRSSAYPRAALQALGEAGLLGLISSKEVGGLGYAHRAAVEVIERLAQACGSTAMVTAMHYGGTAVIEAHGSLATRTAIASGQHVTTFAFSESGSRTHFWAPLSTATRTAEGVRLDAQKSWVTSAGQADSYVWSSKPLAAEGMSSLWLVPAKADGLQITAPFDGMGMRGNHSSPVTATGVLLGEDALLGEDGKGFDVMMSVALPYFQVMNCAASLGLIESAVQKTIQHLTTTRLEHLNQTLNQLPTNRAYLARMKIKTDLLRTLLDDTVSALESGRADAMLRVLQVKAAGGEAATEVTDLAMRVCGGAAFRKEVGVERNFRDARASTVMAPTADMLYEFIGRALTGMPLFG
jgi:alkylation response protein AidB-like acyl-CoA dehydrogenase